MIYSFIVPIFNVEKYLTRCINSIIGQDFRDFEVLLINDGSQDSSLSICEKFEKTDSRITVYSKPNGGLSDARNFGLDRAKGDFIIFVDSDDYVADNLCSSFLPYANGNYDIIRGNASIVGDGDGVIRSLAQNVCSFDSGINYIKEMFIHGEMPMAVWLNIYSRSFLNNNCLRFKKGILHEDEEFTPRAFLKARKIIDTNIIHYYYVIRDNSIMTKKDKRKNAKDMLSTCYELEKIISDIPDKQFRETFLDSLVSKYLSIFQEGELGRYGDEYLPKSFLKRNAYKPKTKLKVKLLCVSPGLYSRIHNLLAH